MSATGTEARVCADIASRQQLGIAKYGTTVAENPLALKEWLEHAYQEALDQAVYLKRAIERIDAIVEEDELLDGLDELGKANHLTLQSNGVALINPTNIRTAIQSLLENDKLAIT